MSDERSTYERMVAGEPYVADDPQIGALFDRAYRLSRAYDAAFAAGPEAAHAHLARLLGSIGKRTIVRPSLTVDYGRHVSIGSDTFVNFGLVALDPAPIRIGDFCQIGPNVQLLTPTHPVEPGPRRAGVEAARPITIGDNVWLGGGVIVLPGVTIGEDAVVGAGSVVTRDVPPGTMVAGNPARAIRPAGP